jgi:hypothetical protein
MSTILLAQMCFQMSDKKSPNCPSLLSIIFSNQMQIIIIWPCVCVCVCVCFFLLDEEAFMTRGMVGGSVFNYDSEATLFCVENSPTYSVIQLYINQKFV